LYFLGSRIGGAVTFPDFVGLIGTISVLVAFFLLQSGFLQQQRPLYSILNGIGAACIMFSLLYYFNLASFILNFCWLLISAVGLYRALRGAAAAR
jgi:hypothetical protein